MVKKMVCGIIFFGLVLFLLAQGGQAEEKFSLTVHRGSVSENVYLPGISAGVTYFPVREMAELIDLPLQWDEETGSVVWYTYRQVTVITPGIDMVYFVKGDQVEPSPYPDQAFARGGKVYIPVRMLELLGIDVWYDLETGARGLNIPADIKNHPGRPPEESMIRVKNLIKEEKKKLPQKLGGFFTYFNLSYRSRTKNLTLAARALDGQEISPGEIFSFNDRVGPRTPQRGYKKAIIFVNKKEVEDYGGGVCQVSTTLYNAVLDAGLPVRERHPHSLPVPYVPRGKDATVSYGSADFKFENNTEMTLALRSLVQNNQLTIEIFSLPPGSGLKTEF